MTPCFMEPPCLISSVCYNFSWKARWEYDTSESETLMGVYGDDTDCSTNLVQSKPTEKWSNVKQFSVRRFFKYQTLEEIGTTAFKFCPYIDVHKLSLSMLIITTSV